ncbi:DTW domain-containing protein YfiP [Nonomuraea endophytica]|uniref:DTW domain-containing protein YfiP n=1 Tax=Nonomuraea endophytica TaxID=714136 RepID=A0A7W8EDW3_9ACTN|nr:DTW domain-containing protein YfiP [Nonomuraea endophytica]
MVLEQGAILNPTEVARAKNTGVMVADTLQMLKTRSTAGKSLLDIDQ